jgi:hypothetical protein
MINSEGFTTDLNLRVPFSGSERLSEFYSQAGQDLFVLSCLDGKKNGFFIDIGCYEPKLISNSYLLESTFNWRGILIDSSRDAVDKCKRERSDESIFVCDDASKINYLDLFESNNVPLEIDYISLDCDGTVTLQALKNLPLDKYQVNVITFEHELYKDGPLFREESRRYLESLGYYRLCSDVCNDYSPYEDWYVSSKMKELDRISPLFSDMKEWKEILFN